MSGRNVPFDEARVLTQLLPRLAGLRTMMNDVQVSANYCYRNMLFCVFIVVVLYQKLSQQPRGTVPAGVLMYRYDLFRFIASLAEFGLYFHCCCVKQQPYIDRQFCFTQIPKLFSMLWQHME
jgi:hypothetical protein